MTKRILSTMVLATALAMSVNAAAVRPSPDRIGQEVARGNPKGYPYQGAYATFLGALAGAFGWMFFM